MNEQEKFIKASSKREMKELSADLASVLPVSMG
jgi:hypothetical protein